MVRRDPVMARLSSRALVAIGAAAVLVLAACGPGTPSPRSLPTGGLTVHGAPGDAMLFVDDKYLGTLGSIKGPIKLPEGVHRIEVRKDGYFAHFAEVQVARGVKQRLEVTLRKQPF